MSKNLRTATNFALAVMLHIQMPTAQTQAALARHSQALLPDNFELLDTNDLGMNVQLPKGAENMPIPAEFGAALAAMFGVAAIGDVPSGAVVQDARPVPAGLTTGQEPRPAVAVARTPLNAAATSIGANRAAAAAAAAVAVGDDEDDEAAAADEEPAVAGAAVAAAAPAAADASNEALDPQAILASLGLNYFIATIEDGELPDDFNYITNSDGGFSRIVVVIDRVLTFPEVAKVTPCLAYALAQMNNQAFKFGEDASPQEVTFRNDHTILTYNYDSTGAQRTNLEAAWTKAFNEAPQYIDLGTPVRTTDREGPGTAGTRKFEGIGGEPTIVIGVA